MILKILIALFAALGVFVAVLTMGRLLNGGHVFIRRTTSRRHRFRFFQDHDLRLRRFFRDVSGGTLVSAIVMALCTGAVVLIVQLANDSNAYGWGIPSLIVMIGMITWLSIWYARRGCTRFEYLWYAVAILPMAYFMVAAAWLTTRLTTSDVLTAIIIILTWIFVTFWPVFCMVSSFFYNREIHLQRAANTAIPVAEREKSEDRASGYRAGAWIAKVCWILWAVIFAWSMLTPLFSAPGGPNPPQPNPTPKSTFWGHWYCQDPETKIDEFGPCPDNVTKMTGQQLFDEMEKRDHQDPLGAFCHVYYRDSLTENRKLAYYYACYQNDTDAINSVIWDYSTDSRKTDGSEYTLFIDEIYSWLKDHNPKYEALTGKQLAERGMDVHDQFYADVYSCRYDADGDEVPSAVVYDCGTGDEQDIYLVITYKVKHREVTEVYHANCGFQPCNASDSMRVEVKPRPNPEPTSAPSGGGKPSGGSDPTPTPTPTPTTTPTPSPTTPPSSGNKNPASDPVNQGNADKGGGDNRASNGGGDYQSSDPRSNADQPSAVKPQTPAVTPDHQSDAAGIVDHQNKMNYEPDAVTDRGSSSTKPPTNSSGDGEFTPAD